MRTTESDVASLVEQVERGTIGLPEIQRAYVWKSNQITGLLDSLYHDYPSGSLLLWEPRGRVEERRLDIGEVADRPGQAGQYLLDVQQRLTSLHRVFFGHPDADIVFNAPAETFRARSKSTSLAKGWVSLAPLLRGELSEFEVIAEMEHSLGRVDPQAVLERLTKAKAIGRYRYHVQILDDHSYEEVTEIFVRVNSRGRVLKTHDLALAALSARWPGAVRRITDLTNELASVGLGDLDEAWILRLLAATTTSVGSFARLTSASIEEVEQGWEAAVVGARALAGVVVERFGIPGSRLVVSDTSLIPVAVMLGLRGGSELSSSEADGTLYWLICSWLSVRYSAAKETRLGVDLAAVRSEDPVRSLLAAGGFDQRVVQVSQSELAGKGQGSPFLTLAFLVSSRAGAEDWWNGKLLAETAEGSLLVAPERLFARKAVSGESGANVNEVANFVFIGDKARQQIAKRSPSDYLVEVPRSAKQAHFVPQDPSLYEPSKFDEFVTARRTLLAEAINVLLAALARGWVQGQDTKKPQAPVARVARSLRDGVETLLVATGDGALEFVASLPIDDLIVGLGEVEGGLLASIGSSPNSSVPLNTAEDRYTAKLTVGRVTLAGTPGNWLTLISSAVDTDVSGRLGDLQVVDVSAGDRSESVVLIDSLVPVEGELGRPARGLRERTMRAASRGSELLYKKPLEVNFDYNGVKAVATFDPESGRTEITAPERLVSSWASPSGAASFVVEQLNPGVNPRRNGWIEWMLENGQPIESLRG